MRSIAPNTRRRLWREYSDVRRRLGRRGSAVAAMRHFTADRRDLESWNRETSSMHLQYRHECGPPIGEVAIVCVTHRAARAATMVDNIMRQAHRPSQVAIVVNGLSEEFERVDEEVARLHAAGYDAEVTYAGADVTLGACLNEGLRMVDSRYVAKFDDDDRYGANYLGDALIAHGYAGAGIVGKHTWYAHLESTDETILRFPGNEFIYTTTLAGASLVLDRSRVGGLQFRDTSVGEDRAIVRDCNRLGWSTFAADRFNLLVGRHGDHAWKMTREQFVEKSVVLGPGRLLEEVEL